MNTDESEINIQMSMGTLMRLVSEHQLFLSELHASDAQSQRKLRQLLLDCTLHSLHK